MTKRNICPTDGLKRSTLDHIFYEIEQLPIGNFPKTRCEYINNALLEAALIHVRALLEFYEVKKDKEKVLSGHYGFRAKKICIPKNDRERLHKDLAHLTYSRESRIDKGWKYESIVRPVLVRSRRFVKRLLKDDLLNGCSTDEAEKIRNRCKKFLSDTRNA